MIDTIKNLSHLIKSNAATADIKKVAERVYLLLDAFIKSEAAAAETLEDWQALDEFRIVRNLLKNKFRIRNPNLRRVQNARKTD